MKSNPLISVVSPVYKGEGMVGELVSRIKESVSAITSDFEVILVNDASPDHSWDEILIECHHDQRIKGINLSRNFGQHKAISAGLNHVKGDWIVVMDCDLQDLPEEIPNLYRKTQEGYDIVFGERVNRQDTYLKKMSSVLYNKMFNFISGLKKNKKIANFGIFKKNVIEEVCKMTERDRAFSILVNYVGFKSTSIAVKHSNRFVGSTSYTPRKLFRLAFGTIVTNSNKPLRLSIGLGFISSLISLLIAAYNIIAYFMGLITVPGFTTTVFSIWFVGGLILMQLGVVGIYIGKTFDQVKGRPLYVVRDVVNIES